MRSGKAAPFGRSCVVKTGKKEKKGHDVEGPGKAKKDFKNLPHQKRAELPR